MENKVYKVKISSVDKETGNETVESNLTLKNVFLLGESVEDKKSFASVIMNTSLMTIAMMLASNEETQPVVKLANVMIGLVKDKSARVEDALLNAIMEG